LSSTAQLGQAKIALSPAIASDFFQKSFAQGLYPWPLNMKLRKDTWLLTRFTLSGHWLVGLVCLAALVGCGAGRIPVAPGSIPTGTYVSAEDEAYGHQVLSTLTATYPLSRDDMAINRVRGLVQRLATAGKVDQHPWNVFVLEDTRTINAAATRGN
jgi:hypothetical protein